MILDLDQISEVLHQHAGIHVSPLVRREADYIRNSFEILSPEIRTFVLTEIANNRRTAIDLHSFSYENLPENARYLRAIMGFDRPAYQAIVSDYIYETTTLNNG
jgi:hypothetical protein